MIFWNPKGDNHKAGVTWGQWIGRPECPYARRWVLNFRAFSVRVHHWVASDDPRFFHDHAWAFLTVCLRGGYVDASPAGDDRLRVGSVRYRAAEHRHTVHVDPGGAWTVLVTGPVIRDWGFWTDRGWLRMRRYFRKYGHHICE